MTQQLIIRISNDSLTITKDLGEKQGICHEPYDVKGGISMAANLREAFKTNSLLQQADEKVMVILDVPTLILPLEDFQKEEMEEQYRYVFPSSEGEAVEMCVLPSFRNAAVFSINKDLKTVLYDHFREVKLKPVMASVWEYLLKRSYGGNNKKLYAYFHDGKMELCSFARNRFTFVNSYEVDNHHDALYFILGAWKQIGATAMVDDLFIIGRVPEKEELTNEAKQFLARVFHINPSTDFSRSDVTQNIALPLDLMLEFV